MHTFLKKVHSSWHNILTKALSRMNSSYLNELESTQWLPGPNLIFNAFSMSLDSTRYIMWGESPYPRLQSANGYAFWDNAVTNIWSDSGFSKAINRATSLRNLLKMLLVAQGALSPAQINQTDIAQISKQGLISQLAELFQHLLNDGFLLLNASLVLNSRPVVQEARFWLPFMQTLLEELALSHSSIQLVLLGNVAKTIGTLPEAKKFPHLVAEHPYNISFIHNPNVLNFFRPFELLKHSVAAPRA